MGLKGLVIVLQSLLRYGGLWQGVSPDIVEIVQKFCKIRIITLIDITTLF